MSKTIKAEGLAAALEQELTTYHGDIVERINAAGETAIKKLKSLTKASAPVESGSFKRNIATKDETYGATGEKRFTWYVKPPDHRLTHLLVHGHATRNGGRTKANPFLQDALDKVLPEYEKSVKEALQK